MAVGVNFDSEDYQEAVSDKVMIHFSCPSVATELVLPFTAGDAETIVVLQVKAFSESGGRLYALRNCKYYAADIIDIIPSLPEEVICLVYNNPPKQKVSFHWEGVIGITSNEAGDRELARSDSPRWDNYIRF